MLKKIVLDLETQSSFAKASVDLGVFEKIKLIAFISVC